MEARWRFENRIQDSDCDRRACAGGTKRVVLLLLFLCLPSESILLLIQRPCLSSRTELSLLIRGLLCFLGLSGSPSTSSGL